ncbi:hypothetical protein L861_12490 [Litchfieldella anticariensis FP35 = DSM 16096]|uniref:YjiS-like domain-containing protein n=1 Tax=Litchfieldella anticariensis (strain DSM 16096 / CECT 5854 / CIP 108499 / LMG 22089 / FP35) TaxID=1121939 RepID=S2KHH6_LITA3|nr:DUF1127 domain-containing protein [Halomonas anticariensis]EPC01385.1 hypothetical protein L861_12490 [Halomonas anticariensis FP35 = DSM 16096]
MTLFRRFARVLERPIRKYRERRSYQAVSHLDDHLLRDIGLRREREVIVPIYPDGEPQERVPASTRNRVVKQKESGVTRCCPHCGASLA